MSVFWIKTLQFLLSLSIIVVIHELGHFLGARVCKTRVDKFYLFFNPWFSLFKKKYKHTEYGIGWIPLGGFVKISGMVDESMDSKQLNSPAQPWEYRSKKPWQKLIMITGGVVFNFLLAWFIYFMLFFIKGESYVDAQSLPYGIATDSLAKIIGLKDGDIILSLDGHQVQDFDKIVNRIILGEVKKITVKRENKVEEVSIPENFGAKVINQKNLKFISIRFLNGTIDSVEKKSLAEQLGLIKGDKILAVNQTPIVYNNELQQTLYKLRYHEISLKILRNDSIFITPIKLLGSDPKLGLFINISSERALAEIIHTKHFSFFEAVVAGFRQNLDQLKSYWDQLAILFGGEINLNENLGGLISMGKLFPSEWSWVSFWKMTALLSIIIGFMNILPVPALDGGHMVIILWEWITGKTIPLKALEIIQTIGIILLIGIMLYAQGLDIFRLFS